jgi:hypothetical protein
MVSNASGSNLSRSGCKRLSVHRVVEKPVVGHSARHDDLALADRLVNRCGAGIAYQHVRRPELLGMLADVTREPGGEAITEHLAESRTGYGATAGRADPAEAPPPTVGADVDAYVADTRVTWREEDVEPNPQPEPEGR